jgi:protein-S-isoprenylcysteine O-methyltransferase Ste14
MAEAIDRRRLAANLVVTFTVLGVLLFLPAGRLDWDRGWIFVGYLAIAAVVITTYLSRVNPDVIAGRVNRHEGNKRWDRLLMGLVFLPLLLATLVVAALDDGRMGWSRVAVWPSVVGYGLMTLAFVGLVWAESVNRFFEPGVRIQTDRGHHVVDTGPYRIVRHPGYLSALALLAGLPLALGSWWAVVPSLAAYGCVVVRTALEDRTLQAELPGYAAYAMRVRYRLLPGVW